MTRNEHCRMAMLVTIVPPPTPPDGWREPPCTKSVETRVSQPKKACGIEAAACKPRSTRPPTRPANPEIRPCAWNSGSTFSNRSRGPSAKPRPTL